MSFEYFISKKVLNKEVKNNKVSRPIIKIAVISISLAVVVNLLTLAVVNGFQREVRDKIAGFTSPIFITNQQSEGVFEASPIKIDKELEKIIYSNKSINRIDRVAYKPLLVQSDKFSKTYKLSNGKDTISYKQEIQGGIFKGVEKSYNWNFLRKHLYKGRIPRLEEAKFSNEVIISKKLANNLHLNIGDRLTSFFVNKSPIKRYFKIVGIYNTGLEDFDNKLIFGDLKHVQKLNDWGVNAAINIDDSLNVGALVVRADVVGGNGNYRYDWGEGFDTYEGFTFFPSKDTLIRLIASDFLYDIREPLSSTTLSDTAYLKVKCKYSFRADNFIVSNEGEIVKEYLNETGTKYFINTGLGKVEFEQIDGKGSSNQYISGYEVGIDDWSKLKDVKSDLKKAIIYSDKKWMDIKVTSIIDNQNDIFLWLSFLDVNVMIIIVLMLIIGVINICSALLVLILMKGGFIGLLKALGATNWSIRKIFLFQGVNIVLKGLMYGNLIGLFLCFLQSYFGLIKLNPAVYYLDKVPVYFNWSQFIILNIGTIVICTLSLIIPSFVITRLMPSKTIKFN